jgi:hypothetical protein
VEAAVTFGDDGSVMHPGDDPVGHELTVQPHQCHVTDPQRTGVRVH